MEPLQINYWMKDVIKEFYPKRKQEEHIYKIWSYNRYIQFATSYYPNGCARIHYELCASGYLELHFEGQLESKLEDLSQYLYHKTKNNDHLLWEARDNYNLGTCRIDVLIDSESALRDSVNSFCSLIDKYIDEYKNQEDVDFNIDYDVSRLNQITQSTIESVNLFDNMVLNDILHLNLNIPSYQRIYCWQEKNVRQLLDDIFSAESEYRMGTIILHHNGDKFDIIDGQQRLVTISLILRKLGYDKSPLLLLRFNSSEARDYIAFNRSIIDDYINSNIVYARFDAVKKILEKLEFSVLVLNTNKIDLAYTFFSNENSRGKSLSDFDLLKAHHLRYVTDNSQSEHLAKNWDRMLNDANVLYEDDLEKPYFRALGLYIFRLRKWIRRDEWDDFMSYKIKNEYEAAPIMNEIPPFGEQFIYNESLQGGTHFFEYVKHFEYKYKMFIQTEEFKSIHKLENRTHWWFRDVIETFLFAYYLKFGVDYLGEALIGISRIVSQFRYDFKRADYGRLLRQSSESSIIFIIDRSTSPTFVIAELKTMIKKLPSVNVGLTPIAIDYHRQIRNYLSDIKRNCILIEEFKQLI